MYIPHLNQCFSARRPRRISTDTYQFVGERAERWCANEQTRSFVRSFPFPHIRVTHRSIRMRNFALAVWKSGGLANRKPHWCVCVDHAYHSAQRTFCCRLYFNTHGVHEIYCLHLLKYSGGILVTDVGWWSSWESFVRRDGGRGKYWLRRVYMLCLKAGLKYLVVSWENTVKHKAVF